MLTGEGQLNCPAWAARGGACPYTPLHDTPQGAALPVWCAAQEMTAGQASTLVR